MGPSRRISLINRPKRPLPKYPAKGPLPKEFQIIKPVEKRFFGHTMGQLDYFKDIYRKLMFPYKLWKMATDRCFLPINWTRDGQCLIIDMHVLKHLLKYVCEFKKIKSFRRKLAQFGFKKIPYEKDQDQSSIAGGRRLKHLVQYERQKFYRDRYDLLKYIHRKKDGNRPPNASGAKRVGPGPNKKKRRKKNKNKNKNA